MSSQDPCPVLYPETTAQLPLFGYTVYVVLRVSKLVLPGPVLLGLNRQHLVLMDPSSQVGSSCSCVGWDTPRPGHPSHSSLLSPTRGTNFWSICCPRNSAAPSP